VTYALLVLVMWLPFNPCGGMPYESHFLFNSEVWPIKGILFPSDSLRPHTSTFYHLSFVLGEVLGIGGSFVPFQIVYAALWWARGFLVFLILRRWLPGQSLFAFCCGALVVAHASDHALMWVGQLNQFGFIFWMLLAFYLYLRAVESDNVSRGRWLLAGALFTQYMSLWSYESQLLLILAAPVAMMLSERFRVSLNRKILAAWYIVPALYLALTAHKYLTGLEGSYQSSVLRTSWSFAALAHDLWFNVIASLRFWRWSDNVSWPLPPEWLHTLGLLGAGVFMLGSAGVIVFREEREELASLSSRAWVVLLAVSLFVVVLSFPAYLFLDSAASLWRTQFLSGIGAALVWGSLAGLAGGLLPGRLRDWPFLALGALIVFFGTANALRLAAMHDQIWSRHRQAVEALLQLAPRLPERSIVVATGVPKANDPFGSNMWFNFALKLTYPGSRISGVYFYDDGTPAAGNHLRLEGTDWVWDGSFESPGYERREVENTLALSYESVGKAHVLEELPGVLSPAAEATRRYDPRKVIQQGPPSPRALRRYAPCPQWWWTLSPRP
jgi:hypothetical protein